MKFQSTLLAAAALAMPAQAMADPLCATLKAVKPVAEKDKWMSALKTGPGELRKWRAAKQIDGFDCVVTIGTTPSMTRGFYSCTWAGTTESQPLDATIATISACLSVTPTVETKSYATTTLWELRAQPRMWVALNRFNGRPFSFSLIAE